MQTPKLWAGVTGRHCLLTTGGLIGVRWLVAWRAPALRKTLLYFNVDTKWRLEFVCGLTKQNFSDLRKAFRVLARE
jgi:hypothetical protein